MICPSCKGKFKLVTVGNIECPVCGVSLNIRIGEFSTNVEEFKKFAYLQNFSFVIALISIPIAYSLGGKHYSISVALIPVLISFLITAVFGGYISSIMGPLLSAKYPKTFAACVTVIFAVLTISVLDLYFGVRLNA